MGPVFIHSRVYFVQLDLQSIVAALNSDCPCKATI